MRRSRPPKAGPPPAEKPLFGAVKMYWVYILKSKKDGRIYIGSSSDLKNRLAHHNSGKVRSTKSRRPFQLMYHEKYDSVTEARKRENFLKSGQGRKWVKETITKNHDEFRNGGMAEWTNAAVSKTVVPKGIVGSNPTSSVSLRSTASQWWGFHA